MERSPIKRVLGHINSAWAVRELWAMAGLSNLGTFVYLGSKK